MPRHLAFVTFAVALIAHDVKTHLDARKAARLYLSAHQAHEETEAAYAAQISYLARMLDEHGVTPSEFDLIALNYHS